jgi:NAD(P)-dependent dehydrogenase (short-subunit alcohol dehydrogenase family)
MMNGKVAVVTGASTGIGRAIACALAREGTHVALISRPSNRLNRTKELIEQDGGSAVTFPCDLRDVPAIERIAREIQEQFGATDFIVNCAGVWHNEDAVYAGVPLQNTPVDQILEVLEVTLVAPFILTRSLLPKMIERKSGKILQVSGTFESGASGWLHYYVAKKGLEDFTEGLAQELREHEIQVNAVSPSDTKTEAYTKFFPDTLDKDCVTPEEIADKVLFLLSDRANNITGATIVVRNKAAH